MGVRGMTLAVLTPSYAPDFASFEMLHRSVVAFTDPEVVHHAIVPDEDVELFRRIDSSRLIVIGYREILPASFVSTAWFARAVAHIPGLPRGLRFIAINRERPWPPLRGWLLQQIVKLSVAMRVEADLLLLVDSDMQIIAPIQESAFLSPDGSVRFYTRPGAITVSMTRHVRWHDVARELIGVAPDSGPPYDDPIAGLVAWDPTIVARCIRRISEVGTRSWESTIARQWDFSEYVLYGEYLAEFGTASQRSFVSDRTLCLNYWETVPLTFDSAAEFIEGRRPDDLSMRIQSTSGTPDDVREFVRRELTRRAG
jgi:hypothetical protein